MRLTAQRHVMPTLGMSGAKPLLSLHTPMARTGTALPYITTVTSWQHSSAWHCSVHLPSAIQRMQISALTQVTISGLWQCRHVSVCQHPTAITYFPDKVHIRPKHAALPINHVMPTNNCVLGRCFIDCSYSCTILHRHIM